MWGDDGEPRKRNQRNNRKASDRNSNEGGKSRIARELKMELIRNNSSGDERSALRTENLPLDLMNA